MINLATGAGHLFLVHYGLLAGALASGLRITSQLAAMSNDLELASRAALTDPLTGARNRAFCENLRIAPGDVVAVVDFDRFKDVNDHHGHERGDRLLSEFVRAALFRLRGNDHVIRLGGDEFALVVRDADPASAARVVEEVLASWRASATDLVPTASVGLTRVGDRTFTAALAEADRQMYRAKTSRATIVGAETG
jgi:diguanylate cyclase (GGDEF)-like protein